MFIKYEKKKDNWLNFTIGNRKFFRIRHCTRCLMTTIDPDLGAKSSDQEPLKTLKTYRLNKEVYGSSPQFGIHISLDDNNENSLISIGDKLIV